MINKNKVKINKSLEFILNAIRLQYNFIHKLID
jgi:hypothetical protein